MRVRDYHRRVTSLPPSGPVRLNGITGLRWWAAFAVFCHHFLNLAPLPPIVAGYAKFGSLGVTFFFVLSGFVLTWSWNAATDRRTFYWRRFARIYPLHLITLLLAVPVFYRLTADPAESWIKPFDIGLLLLSVVLLQGWSRDPAIQFSGNPAAWTLTVEAFFYALHPFVIAPLRRLRIRGALIAAAALLALAVAIRGVIIAFPETGLGGWPWPIMHFYEFGVGMCIAWAFRCGWRLRVSPWLWVGLLFLYCTVLLALRRPETQHLANLTGAFVIEVVTTLCVLLIASVATRDIEGRSGWLSTRPLVALGEWSFALYLIHATILYPARELFGFQDGSYLRSGFWFVAILGLSILASWLLHAFVERPLERRLRRWQQACRARHDHGARVASEARLG